MESRPLTLDSSAHDKSFVSQVSRKRVVWLFVITLTVFNLNLVPHPHNDTTSAALLPFSVVIHHSIYLDDFVPYYKAKNSTDSMYLYFFSRSKDHYLSSYPIALPLAISPLYYPFVKLFRLENAPISKIVMFAYPLSKLFASVIAALSVCFMYIVLVMLFGDSWFILLLSFAYAFGTTIWSQASQLLFQHGFGCLMILAASAFFLGSKEKRRYLLFSGICVALAVAERYNNVFFAAMITFIILGKYYKRPSALVAFFTGPIIIGSLLLWYNFYYFHSIIGNYPNPGMKGNVLSAFAGLLISPSRGLFVYSPFLIASIVGIFIFFKDKKFHNRGFLLGTTAVIIINFVFLCRWGMWWGGWSYGPRLLTEIVPLLIMFIPFTRTVLKRVMAYKVLFSVSLVMSIIIHGIGVFCYPNGLSNALPVNIDVSPDRLWSIRNCQILVEARAGFYTEMFENIFNRVSGRGKTTAATGTLPQQARTADLRIFDMPDSMQAGYSYRIPFTVRNKSSVTWPALGQNDGTFTIFLSSYMKSGADSSSNSDAKVMVYSRNMIWDLSPDRSWKNNVFITAPQKAGIYTFGFDIYQQGAGWFHDSVEYKVVVKN
jgi:hypothetical protein